MKIGKYVRRGLGAALACALAFAGLGLVTSQAAVEIEFPETGGSLSIKTPKELEDREISVNLYKVADIGQSGSYQALASLGEAFGKGLGEIGPESKAADWEALAVLALKALAGEDVSYVLPEEYGGVLGEDSQGMFGHMDGTAPESPAIAAPADGTVTVNGGTGTWKLDSEERLGLYLIVAENVFSADMTKEYAFTPSLISIPDNAYGRSGGAEGDQWIYDVTVYLKAAEYDLSGSLSISKTLESYNPLLGPATFVFQIEEIVDEGTVLGREPYSNVVSLVFSAEGTQSVTLSGLPAGARVRVTEVYTGPSYSLVGQREHIVEIASDKAADGEAGAAVGAAVDFTNEYNGNLVGGTSVENRFTFNKEEMKWNEVEQALAGSPEREEAQ